MKNKNIPLNVRSQSKFFTGFSENLVPLEPLDLSKIKDFDELAKAMSLTTFGGRGLGEAVDVAEAMMRDKECFKVLTLSGAMTMAQMSLLICDMIEHGMVNAIVSTGALMSHGFVESIGMIHYKNPDNMSDEEIAEAVQLINGQCLTEASGNMTLQRVEKVARLGVDFISVGQITHSAAVADVSLLFN